MNKKIYDGYTYVDGGVCAAKGFTANGLNCGLNPDKNKNDLGMVFSEVPCVAAGVYTQNKVKGAPVTVTKEHLKKSGNKAQAVIVNSKNANTCNADGIEKAEKISQLAADALGIDVNLVINASTGVIGQIIPIEPFEEHMKELADGLTADGNDKAANAIMTTDTVDKQVAVQFDIDGVTCTLGGMAKGSGMIHPNMATTLNFITSDIAITSELIQKALSEIVKVTYNCLSVDGDQSTNDTLTVMANGLAGNKLIDTENEAYEKFKKALYIVMECMTMMLASDGEGATKMIECTVAGAPDLDTAIIVAKSVIRSPLTKCAMFGEDANWGRILCALGYSGAKFDPENVDLYFESKSGKIHIFGNGVACDYSEEEATKILSDPEVTALVDMHMGEAEATAWGCDLSYDYVKINADYRS